jgi:hypothetical protein
MSSLRARLRKAEDRVMGARASMADLVEIFGEELAAEMVATGYRIRPHEYWLGVLSGEIDPENERA